MEYILIGYGVWTILSLIFGAYVYFETYVEHTLMSDLIEQYNFNHVGNICMYIFHYILLPGFFIIDLFLLLKILFKWHPKHKEKKIKKSQLDEFSDKIDFLIVRCEEIDREIGRIKKDLYVMEGENNANR